MHVSIISSLKHSNLHKSNIATQLWLINAFVLLLPLNSHNYTPKLRTEIRHGYIPLNMTYCTACKYAVNVIDGVSEKGKAVCIPHLHLI